MSTQLWIELSGRAFVGCYLARVAIDLGNWRPGGSAARTARNWWTAGAACCWLHILLAMLFKFGGQFAAAHEHTLQRTAALTGWSTGVGIYFNFALAIWWLVDVAIWWAMGTNWPRCSAAYFAMLHTFFAFMMFNATVVFGPPFWIWVLLGLAGCAIAAAARRPWPAERTSTG